MAVPPATPLAGLQPPSAHPVEGSLGKSASPDAEVSPNGGSGKANLATRRGGKAPPEAFKGQRPPSVGSHAVDLGKSAADFKSCDDSLRLGAEGARVANKPALALGTRPGKPDARLAAGSDFCALEIGSTFCGISKLFAENGMPTIAIDHFKAPRAVVNPALRVDLHSEAGWAIPFQLVKEGGIHFVHIDPPRPSFQPSRPNKRVGIGLGTALRSKRHPRGKPNLDDRAKVLLSAGNLVLDKVASLVVACVRAGVLVSLAHPSSSLLWKSRRISRLNKLDNVVSAMVKIELPSGRHLVHRFVTNVPGLPAALDPADNIFQVSSLGKGYPEGLKFAIFNAVALTLGSKGFKVPVLAPADGDARASKRAAAGRQPRGHKYPAVIDEFARRLHFEIPANMYADLGLSQGQAVSALAARVWDVPEEAKAVKCDQNEGGRWSVEIGVPHSVVDFNEKACKLWHPFDLAYGVSDDNKQALFELLTLGPREIQRRRDMTLRYYMRRAAALAQEERTLKSGMTEAKRNVMKGKRVRLLLEMCRDAGVYDEGLETTLCSGVDLVGTCPDAAEFSSQLRPAQLSVEQVKLASRLVRASAMSKRSMAEFSETDVQVWEKTLDEISKGWLSGPYTIEELDAMFDGKFLVSRRFGVVQNQDTRVIDDFSESLVNPAFSSPFKAEFEGIDEIATTAKLIMESVTCDGVVILNLSNGKALRGRLHPELDLDSVLDVVVRLLDLKSAYKQLLVSETSRWASPIMVLNTDKKAWEVYIPEVMPFGATAAVYGFTRTARAIKRVGSKLFNLVWTNYFDDYCQFDLALCGDNSKRAAEKFLALVGWEFATKESKRRPFGKVADALGATIDLSASKKGVITVRNKASRLEELKNTRARWASVGWVTQPEADSLKGKLGFAEGQLFVRVTALMMPKLRRRAFPGAAGGPVDEDLLRELDWMIQFLGSAISRQLVARDTRPPVVVMTDAALEERETHAGLGAVLLGANAAPIRYIAETIPVEVLLAFQRDTEHVINGLELLAVYLVRRLWKEQMIHRRIFVFIDNEAARFSLLRMHSDAYALQRVLRRFAAIQADTPAYIWYARVPSSANAADAPSRGVLDSLQRAGASRTQVPGAMWAELT